MKKPHMTDEQTALRRIAKAKQQGTKHLSFRDLGLDKIPAALSELTGLEQLDLSLNRISDLTPLVGLSQLTRLDLDSNQISDLAPLVGLSQLTRLDVVFNPIQTIRPLQPWLAQGIAVYLNFDIEDGLYIRGCPIQDPPLDIIRQDKKSAAILRYFELTADGNTQPIHEAKLIIVGEPSAGKTTLLNKLFDPDYPVPNPNQDSTIGIDVREDWTFPLSDQTSQTFRANIWDFGGQEIQYMTHQFFLTPSALYVLVADDRAQLTRFPYWFKIINLLGQERGYPSPVIVVLNQKNNTAISNFDIASYQTQYPDLAIQVQTINFAENDTSRLQQLTQAIQIALPKLRHVGDQLPEAWLQIRLQLRTLAKQADHIRFDEFQAICVAEGVTDTQDQLMVSQYLHRLGSLLHFQRDRNLRDFIVLNPKWVVDAVYSVLQDERVLSQGGRFQRADLDAIWQADYTLEEQAKLINLMAQDNFEICYPTDPGAESYIAPQFLPNKKPDYAWSNADCLQFQLHYAFMPEGIITRLIVRLHDLIDRVMLKSDSGQEQECDLVWQTGVVFKEKGCRAQVILDEHHPKGLQVIDIRVIGEANERKYLLRRVRDQINKIHTDWFASIVVEQMVPCDCTECAETESPYLFEFKQLNKFLRNKPGKPIQCHESGEDVPVRRLLEGVFESDELLKQDNRTSAGAESSTVNIQNKIIIPDMRPDTKYKETEGPAPSIVSSGSSEPEMRPIPKTIGQKVLAWFCGKVLSAALAGLFVVWLAYMLGWS